MSRQELDEARFEALVEEFGAVLRAQIRRVCSPGCRIELDDIEQEARLRLWTALRSEREIANPVSYFYKVATTATIDAMRRARARREEQLTAEGDEAPDGPGARPVHLADPNASPEKVAERREIVGKLGEALKGLPERRRRCVVLHLQGFTSNEIAQLMSWTEPKARNLLYRGLRELRRRLSRLGIVYEG